MKKDMELKQLTAEDIECIDGGVAPILAGLLWGGGYIGALQVAADFGRGLGIGLYDGIHRDYR